MLTRIKKRKPLLIACLLAATLLGGCATTRDTEKLPDAGTIMEEARTAYANKEYERVFQLVFPLATAGNDQAQYTLGYLFYNGLGIEKSESQAMNWIQRAAAQGNKKALQALK